MYIITNINTGAISTFTKSIYFNDLSNKAFQSVKIYEMT